jgi:phenylacetate-CoA ligase
VLDTGIRQFRMAMGIVWGRRLDPTNIERLVGDALATLAQFGEPGEDVGMLVDGPLTDPAARRQSATSNVRRTAKRLSVVSPFYARRFAAAGTDVGRLDPDGLGTIPVTVKRDLIERGRDFQATDVPAYLATRTTGTTGRPAEIWMSRYETRLWPAMGALAAVLRDDIRPDDVLQVNVSSRATAAVTLDIATCGLIGAGCRVLGVIPPDEALDGLGEGGVTLLSATPSYLGDMVTAARRRGLGPADFRLRRVDVGGEVLSPSLAAAARATFGVPEVNDHFGMTEILPVTGRSCEQGHLHHDINTGHVEYLDPDTGAPAAPGALATVVVTPYFPYRECMPVFRYDTRDLVQRLPDEPLTCSLSGLPATTKVLGKADQTVRMGERVVTPRELVEAVEALPSCPWPARFRAVVDGDRLRLTLPTAAVAGFGVAATVAHLADRGLDVDLELVPDVDATRLRPLRCDLRESTFAARPVSSGV